MNPLSTPVSPATRLMGTIKNNKMTIGLVVLGLVLLALVITYIVFMSRVKLATPDTIRTVATQRIAVLNQQIEPTANSVQSISSVGTTLSDAEQLLINYSPKACRLAGFLWPLQDGVFSESDAVRLALDTGARFFTLEISALETDPTRPRLVARDVAGYKRSLNDGSISATIKALASKAFAPGYAQSQDPLIIFLYFHDSPNPGTDAAGYLTYLSTVAKALKPLVPYHLGQTTVGDFTRQKMASQLFFFSPDFYSGKVILLTNADTSGFRNPASIGVKRTFSPADDLDFWTHAQVFTKEGAVSLGITATAGTGTATGAAANPSVIVCDQSYFTMTPSDQMATVVNLTRNTYTIVMEADPTWIPSDQTLLTTYGAQTTPVNVFDSSQTSATGWTLKPEALRYQTPAPIVPTIPNPALNANGGSIIAPSA